MPTVDTLREALTSFAILAVLFVPLERAFPMHRQGIAREETTTDLWFFVGQYLVWTIPVVLVLTALHAWVQSLPLDGLRAAVASVPLWIAFPAAVLVSDASVYWAHRFSHSNAFLWRFHRVHHTAPRLDWLAAHREHPFDNLYTRLVENLPLILLGLPLHLLAGFAVFRGLWALYIHSNVALGPGPLRYLLGAPRLHHWHHEPEIGGAKNFANLNPLMDLAFGTYYDPGHDPARYGDGGERAGGFFRQVLEPMLPARTFARLSGATLALVGRARTIEPTTTPERDHVGTAPSSGVS